MSTSATFKRGTTFIANVGYTPATGGPSTLASVTTTSDIITSNGQVYHTTITKAGDNLSFVARYDNTANWELGSAKWDVKFIYAGIVFYSETLRLNIIDQVTN